MQSMTASWATALAAPQVTVLAWAEVWSGIGGRWLGTLQIEAGGVTDDWTNATRRLASGITLVDPTGTLTPGAATDLLYPNGNEILLYSGMIYTGGSPATIMAALGVQQYTPALGLSLHFEAALLGTFLMTSPRMHDSGSDYFITLEGEDRSERVRRAGISQPYSTDGTSTLDVAIQGILDAALPSLPRLSSPSIAYVPPVSAYAVGDDVWAGAQKLASDGGYRLDFVPTGVPTLSTIVDPGTVAPAVAYAEGAGCIVVDLERGLSNKDVPNWIIGMSSGSDIAVPLRQDWQDTDPASPTYIGGNYPTTRQVLRMSSATTNAQVLAAVTAQGLLNKGKLEQVQMRLLANAALQAGDVITLTRTKAKILGSRYVFDRFMHSFGTGPGITGTGRLVA